MPLDSNLFVLALHPRPTEAGWIDFKVDDERQDLAYAAHKDNDTFTLHDPYLEDLIYARLVVQSTKVRRIELDSPRAEVEVTAGTGMSWERKFEWEEHEWVWTRSVGLGSERAFTLSASRKPDPSFPVAIYTPPSKRKHATLQLLDYNIARVDPVVQDKKGFEILTCLSLVSFLDHLFDPALAPVVAGGTPRPSPGLTPTPSAIFASPSQSPVDNAKSESPQSMLSAPLVGGTIKSKGKQVEVYSPQTPARPAKPKRNDSVPAQLSMNEILVTDPKAMEAYTESCLRLLADKSILYIALIGQGAMVPLVVKLGSDVKWKHYKATGEDLRTFIDDGLSQATQGAAPPKPYAAPTNVKVYISRLDELASFLPLYQPKAPVPPKPILRAPINLNAPQPPPRPPQDPRLKKKPSQSPVAEGAPPGGQEGGGGGSGFLGGWFGRK